MFCGLGRGIPAYLFHYPFSPLVIAKAFSIVCILLQLCVWYQLQRHPHFNVLRQSSLYDTCLAIADLITLLFVSISLWFMLQKFFWLQVDLALMGFALLFTVVAAYCTWQLRSTTKQSGRELVYLITCHLYLLVAELFSLFFAMRWSRNQVSNLFIANWGDEVSYNELQQLQLDG